MNKKYDRPFFNYKKQISQLRRRGMNIESYPMATEMLKTHGYYNLINGYKDDFLLPKESPSGEDEYKIGTELIDLVYEKRVENDLQDILFKYTLLVESRFKEAMAHVISSNMGVDRSKYLDPQNYRKPSHAKKVLGFINSRYSEIKSNPTKYYRENHNHVPAWILLSNLSLGQARMWFSAFPKSMTIYVVESLMPIAYVRNASPRERMIEFLEDEINYPYSEWEKNHLSDDEEEKAFKTITNTNLTLVIELARNMITIVHDFRNNIAHGNRLKTFKASQTINYSGFKFFNHAEYGTQLPLVITQDEYTQGLGKRDLFAFLISITTLLDVFNAQAFFRDLEDWKKANSDNERRMKKVFELYFKSTGLPSDFVDRLKRVRGKIIYRD